MWSIDDTIAALASPPGAAARGIVRVSGPESLSACLRSFHPAIEFAADSITVPLRLTGVWGSKRLSAPVRTALQVWPTRRSFTGQPVCELHLPGSEPLLSAVLVDLSDASVRFARRGEFTLRAFLSGRIDLTEAEAVLGVIDARDHDELETALGQLAGGLADPVRQVREELLLLLADLEAGLDFADEDIEFISSEQIATRAHACLDILDRLLTQTSDRTSTAERPVVVLAGLPNAGKSTLLNALTGRDVAIVADVPGTTRDGARVTITTPGAAFDLLDSAGWEPPRDGIESRAAELRAEALRTADLLVWCTPSDLSSEQISEDVRARQSVIDSGTNLIHIGTKSDIGSGPPCPVDVQVSASDRANLSALLAAIARRLEESHRGGRHFIGSTAVRCESSLRVARDSLTGLLSDIELGAGDELLSVPLRESLHALAQVLGEVYTDDILDRIFSRFCIGK